MSLVPSIVRKRLSVRILVFFLVVVTLFGLVLGYFIHNSAKKRYDSEVKLYEIIGKTLLGNLADNIAFGLVVGDITQIESKAEGLFDNQVISYVLVYDSGLSVKYDKSAVDIDVKGANNYHPKEDEPAPEPVARRIEMDGEPFLDFIVEIKLSPEDEEPAGWARLGISLASLERQLQNAYVAGLSMVGIMFVFGLLLALIIQRTIMPPINRLASAARRIGDGNLDVQLEVKSEDELGLLTSTFNDMAESIRDYRNRTEELMTNISAAVMLLTDVTSHLLSITTEQASGVTEQATVVEEVVTTTEEISATADRIADSAGKVNESASQTSEAANKGGTYMEQAVQGMETLREQVDTANRQIAELADQAESIGGVIDIIADISEQTDLLALNAAIEAAGAGEAGKRFSVVAREVRRLANRTLEAAESVREIVQSVQTSINSLVMISENQQQAAHSGAETVRTMGEYFSHILERVEATSSASSEIGLITRQQSTATQQMVSSIHEVEDVAKEVEKGVKEIESSMGELSEMATRLKAIIS